MKWALWASCSLLLACIGRPGQASLESAAHLAGADWQYQVQLTADGSLLEVAASFAQPVDELVVDREALPFVVAVEVRAWASDAPWRAVAATTRAWQLASSCAHGCSVHYRFLLAEAARVADDAAVARAFGAAYVASPSAWLLRPSEATPAARYQFQVTSTDAQRFATGVRALDTGWGAEASSLSSAPYSVFGAFESQILQRPEGATIEVAQLSGALERAELACWIALAARAVEAYYGRFPVQHLLLAVVPAEGGRDAQGTTLASGGASILLGVPRGFSHDDIEADWVLTHELTHLASPALPQAQRWLEEGIATYVEPIARAQLGVLSVNELWQGMLEGLPNGLPAADDQGLDRTHTWGRTYWGGALFCLLADLEIRQRTHGQASLQTALRAILNLGNGETSARIEQVLNAGDDATDVAVLRELYQRHAKQRTPVDLPALFAALGIRRERAAVQFDPHAPLAALRHAITARGNLK